MKFTCNKDDLVNNVSIVQRAVSSNSTVQILNGILIESDNNSKIKLTGYDLQTGIEADMDADVFERGSVVLDSKFFGDIIRKLPESEVEISVNDNFQTVISCGKAEFKISGLDPETFPKIPEVDEASSDKIVMPQKILKSMINHTIFAVSRDNSVVSIDGFRMAINRQNMGNDFPKINYIVPGKALTEMSKILSDEDDAEIILYTSMHNLLFDIGNVRMVSRLIEGNFINFDSIIAKNPKTVITINRKDFLNAVDRAALIIMTDDRKCPVRLLTSNPSELTVSAVSAQGNLQENIEVKVEGDLIDVDFNSRYILDVLKNIEDDTIRVEVNGGQGPCIIKPIEGEDYIYLILPIRR